MVALLLPWLLRGRNRPEYARIQTESEHDGLSWEPGLSAKMLLAIVVARFTFNAVVRGPANRLAQRRGDTPGHRDGSRLLEELWVTLGNSLMLAAALYVMLLKNGGCWFLDTSSCLAGWPNHPIVPEALLYYNLELAWYFHMLLKPALRYGLPDGRDMLLHHIATLALIVVSYGTGLTRIGIVVLALFAVSNPLLHAAKICNQLSLGPLKIGGFMLFALAFFLSRVVLVPLAVLKPALLDSRRDIPYAVEDFHGIYLAINTLLAALYFMQLMWMRGILRVLRSAAQHGSDAASRMSAQVDPAKRYAVGAAAGAGAGTQQQQQQSVAVGVKPQHGRQQVGSAAVAAGQGQPQTPSPEDLLALPVANGVAAAEGKKGQ